MEDPEDEAMYMYTYTEHPYRIHLCHVVIQLLIDVILWENRQVQNFLHEKIHWLIG